MSPIKFPISALILYSIALIAIGLLIGWEHPIPTKQSRYRIDGAACAILLREGLITKDQFGDYLGGESRVLWCIYD